MKRLIGCFFILFVLLGNIFGSVFDNTINEIIEKNLSQEETVTKLKRRIDDLSTKKQDKLKKELLEKNKNTGRTPLFYAAEAMDEVLVDRMITALGNNLSTVINQKDYKGRTILLSCIFMNSDNNNLNISVIKKLIDCGADCNVHANIGINTNLSVLIAAEITGNVELIELIISKVDNVNYIWKETPQSTSVDDYLQMDPLGLLIYIAEDSNKYNNCIRMLLEKGAKTNTSIVINNSEWTPLHYTARFNNKELFNLLKKYGADPSIKDSYGYTVYDYNSELYELVNSALNNNNLDSVKNFLKQDSKKYVYRDADTGSIYRLFTYIAAVNEGTSDKKIELLDYLLDNGYSVKETVEAGEDKENTALFYAAKNNDIELFNYLIEKGSDLLASNYYNETILMYISGYGSKELLKEYLVKILDSDKKALTRKDSNGFTPFLYAAAFNPDPDVMKILRMYGADVFAVDKNNNNASALAAKYNTEKEKIIERLASYGVYNE